jgi:hypothetical protein
MSGVKRVNDMSRQNQNEIHSKYGMSGIRSITYKRQSHGSYMAAVGVEEARGKLWER